MLYFLLTPFVEVYRYALEPVAPFTWFGLPFCLLDVAAALRTCIALRQLREQFHAQHVAKVEASGGKAVTKEVQERSFLRDASATLLVVFGGEAITAPALGIPCSFMISGAGPALYSAIQAVVNWLPSVPQQALQGELPVSVLDGFTRAFLLCDLIPPMIVGHSVQKVSNSPWSLLMASLITANGGWFFVNLFSFLQPYALTVTTPPDLMPFGWTTTDLWCAPVITGLYALLTHAQPFWADAHAVAMGWLGAAMTEEEKVQPVDPEYARAACAALLAIMFSTRTLRNFRAAAHARLATSPKIKVQ
ncbi:uncharacterized protein LAESUDRAFT_671660 [Laetiporus sulphureus 93-53]|uniref:Uncharacterized protein n=1 Tax=Laetiporus sulphureus 93-53 TaxID=1314785 RepID=A0A165HCS7_9APHY|nr:uncharacterized protein LAESUDRAFT_671660 [Laetiporus sulphureus 93-53]KZT11558.1 hypothetical protein LAESUDRAFT_671660 [Laetiporus sulphureus 93-53]